MLSKGFQGLDRLCWVRLGLVWFGWIHCAPKIAREVHDMGHRKLRKQKLRGRKLRGHWSRCKLNIFIGQKLTVMAI